MIDHLLAAANPRANASENSHRLHSESPLEVPSHAGAAFFCRALVQELGANAAIARILVAGCGAGHEAVSIQRSLGAEVDAVDIEDFVSSHFRARSSVRFAKASVTCLPFPDGSFDAVFYHHVIEHVDDPRASLAELARVLVCGGLLFVGTPNRHRLLSSVGAHPQSTWDATLANKVLDNIRDWRDRLTGRFHNHLGAHAGFSDRELDRMLAMHFPERRSCTRDYLAFKYSGQRKWPLVSIAVHPAFRWFAAPAIYYLCRKHGGSGSQGSRRATHSPACRSHR